MKKLDVNDYSFAHLNLILLLHYLAKLCQFFGDTVYTAKKNCCVAHTDDSQGP